MIVSELLLNKRGKARLIFKSTRAAYYKYPDGTIATLTTNNYVPVVGVASFSLKMFPGFIEAKKGLEMEGYRPLFPCIDFGLWNPKVEKVNNIPQVEIYLRKLETKVHSEVFKKIVQHLDSGTIWELIGFGPGLTPLGDDILSGYLLIKSFYGEKHDISRYKDRTTELSYQQLTEASKLLAPSPVKSFLETGRVDEIENMGNTSGLGWLIGIATSQSD